MGWRDVAGHAGRSAGRSGLPREPNDGDGNATIYTIGGSYNLSKRTLLDVQAATVRNSKAGTYSPRRTSPAMLTTRWHVTRNPVSMPVFNTRSDAFG